MISEQYRNRKESVLYSAVQCLYWAQSAVGFAFASYYLKELGFTGTTMGFVFAGANLFGFLLPNALGTLIDRGRLSCFYAAAAVILAEFLGVFPMLFIHRATPLIALCYTLFLSLLLSVNSVYTKIFVDLQRELPDLRYGNPRALGSVSYALCAWGAGLILYGRPLSLIPLLVLILTALQMLVLFRLSALRPSLRLTRRSAQARGRSMAAFLRENFRFILLMLGVAVIFAANNTINNFLYLIVQDLQGTERTLGALNALIGLIEVPVMLLYARKRHPAPQKLLALSLVCFPLKMLAIWASRTTGQLFAAFLLQGLSFALYVPVMVDYVNRAIPYTDSAKGQSLSGSMISMGTLFATLFSGYWLETLSVRDMLFRLVVISLAGLPLCLTGINWKLEEK